MDDWVIVDTCVWASFFTKPTSPEKRVVDQLIDSDRILLVDQFLLKPYLVFGGRTRLTGSRLVSSSPNMQKHHGVIGGPQLTSAANWLPAGIVSLCQIL